MAQNDESLADTIARIQSRPSIPSTVLHWSDIEGRMTRLEKRVEALDGVVNDHALNGEHLWDALTKLELRSMAGEKKLAEAFAEESDLERLRRLSGQEDQRIVRARQALKLGLAEFHRDMEPAGVLTGRLLGAIEIALAELEKPA